MIDLKKGVHTPSLQKSIVLFQPKRKTTTNTIHGQGTSLPVSNMHVILKLAENMLYFIGMKDLILLSGTLKLISSVT